MPWLRMKFKGKQKVYAHVDTDGKPLAVDNKGALRYKLDDPREYTTHPAMLAPIKGEPIVDIEVPDADAARPSSISPNVKVGEKTGKIPMRATKGTLLVFTDGGADPNPGPCSAGAVILEYGQPTIEISEFLGHGTNNIGELTAIERALIAVGDRPEPVHLYTDSTYAIGVLGTGWKAQANVELIEAIKAQMAKMGELTLFKVKGHEGHRWNERADELATAALQVGRGQAPEAPGPPVEEPSSTEAVSREPRKPAPSSSQRPRSANHRLSVVDRPISVPELPPPGVIMAFTDGACSGNPGPAGLGVVLAFGEHTKEISEYLGETTNNVAELTAILRALEAIKDTAKPVELYTDSAYSIGVLAKGWKAKANQALIAEIRRKLTEFDDVSLVKVKGHAGHALNEKVDELARLAIANEFSG